MLDHLRTIEITHHWYHWILDIVSKGWHILLPFYTPPMPIHTSDLFADRADVGLSSHWTWSWNMNKTSWSPRKWGKYRKAWDVPSAQQQPRLTNDCSIIFFWGTGFLLTFVLHFLCVRYRCSLHPRHLAERARLSRPWKMGSILSLNESPTTAEYFPLLRYPPQICNSWCVFNI